MRKNLPTIFGVLFFLGLIVFVVLNQKTLESLKYTLIQERKLGDDTSNSLYRIFDGEEYYFLATNKVVDKSKYKEKKNQNEISVEYLGSDIFWNPERCAQMLSLYTKDRIYFFDTTIANPEENNGNDFQNLMHIYEVDTDVLSTYKLDDYANLVQIEKTNDKESQNDIQMYFRDKEHNFFAGSLDVDRLSINFNLNDSKESVLDAEYMHKLRKKPKSNIYSFRPFIFQARDIRTGEVIIDLGEKDQAHHFLIGF